MSEITVRVDLTMLDESDVQTARLFLADVARTFDGVDTVLWDVGTHRSPSDAGLRFRHRLTDDDDDEGQLAQPGSPPQLVAYLPERAPFPLALTAIVAGKRFEFGCDSRLVAIGSVTAFLQDISSLDLLRASDISIDALELSERPTNCLRRAGINHVGTLIRRTESDLLAITNMGTKSVDEIRTKLDEIGLALRTPLVFPEFNDAVVVASHHGFRESHMPVLSRSIEPLLAGIERVLADGEAPDDLCLQLEAKRSVLQAELRSPDPNARIVELAVAEVTRLLGPRETVTASFEEALASAGLGEEVSKLAASALGRALKSAQLLGSANDATEANAILEAGKAVEEFVSLVAPSESRLQALSDATFEGIETILREEVPKIFSKVAAPTALLIATGTAVQIAGATSIIGQTLQALWGLIRARLGV